MSAVLTWNEQTGRYEALVDGKLIEVDGDAFAETLADMRSDYEDEGLDEETAYDKAFAELIKPSVWIGSTPMYGVFVDGVSQDF